jgi:gliding motility-associated-like protein
MTFRQTLFFILCIFGGNLFAQNCNNPIVVNSILVSNTSCGNSSGSIFITLGGGISIYSYQWTPAVSNSNTANNLTAGTYKVRIQRVLEPNCLLDTTIVVNNSNGPQVQAAITPATCFASNGAVTLSPANLLYNWSNGAGTNSVQNLASGNYYVTATNPNTGCYSVNKIFVPRSFDFNASATVLQQAKCGNNDGKVQIVVPQGSGQYSYSMGAGPIFSGLAPANYTCVVTDIVTGCTASVTFSIQSLSVTGTVNFNTHNVRCPGGANGQVEFSVVPGPDFKTPHTFTLVNTNGTAQSPGNLIAGTYYLQIFDADNCPLPIDTFTISQPPALTVVPQITPETCTAGGSITLGISGGTGTNYAVDWLDISGAVNPRNRSNLEAGLYSLIVYDSLFCTKELNNLLVAPLCNNTDTVYMVVKTNSTDSHCWKKPVGLASNATTFSLIGGGGSGASSYGAWVLNPDGCLAYSAGAVAGFGVDTICLLRMANQIGLKDTLCLIVTITSKQPSKQSVFFSVQAGNSAVACGAIPPQFHQYTLVQLGRPGLAGTSDVYGHYEISPSNGCLSFFANNSTGFSVDEIRVAVCDTLLNECHIICYLPSVVPSVDCSAFVQLADTINIVTTDCNGLATACLPIPYDDIVNYTVINNGVLYNAGYTGCNPVNMFTYNVGALPGGGGPYQLSEWSINGLILSGSFLNLAGLVALMNQLDPGQGWSLQGASFIRGGNLGKTYGPLKVKSASNNTSSYSPQLQAVPMGTEMRFSPGIRKVIVRNVLNACSDTTIIQVDCIDCLPVHNYALNAQGGLVWKAPNGCASDTVLCTNIPFSQISQYLITDNLSSNLEYTNCGNFVGIVLDTGLHRLHFLNTANTCEYALEVSLECQQLLPGSSTDITLGIGEQSTLCLDTSLLGSNIAGLTNICEDDAGSTIIGYTFNTQQWCVSITGLNLGLDTLCLQLCNAANQCVTYTIYVTVTNLASDSLLAVPDPVFTLVNTDVDISIIGNDIVNGVPGNLGGLSAVDFLTQPSFGVFGYNPLTGLLTYSPNLGACGIDSFIYRITNAQGKQSTATITITVVCDKVLVFNGISPNGDGKNDVWHIVGIEQYPENVVRVFNRWGNQVFETKGYTNARAWDGTWNGKLLPDGTYFYVLNLGGAGGALEGYLQILR